jgi:hypothetical protein
MPSKRSQPGECLLLISLCLLMRPNLTVAQNNVIVWGGEAPPGLTNAVSVAAGSSHSLALRRDGMVIAWGNNDYGQTDVPSSLTNAAAISSGAGSVSSVALRSDGHVSAWGPGSWAALRLPTDLTNAAAISAGTDHVLALRTDGTVTAWGANTWGETNVPPDLTNIVAVAAGGEHSLALRADGTVAAWGAYYANQINVPLDLSNAVAVAAAYDQSVALKSDGTVVAWGETGPVPLSVSNVVAITAGFDFVAALKNDGTVMVWDYLGREVAVPSNFTNIMSIAAGRSHILAVTGSGAPFVTTRLTDRTTFRGRAAYFRAAASGAWPLSYQWQFNGTNLAGATDATLALTNVQLTQSGIYTLIVSNALGVAATQGTLSVIPQIAQLLLESLTFSNGRFQFNATASPLGTFWTVQASTNLVDWRNVGTLANDTGMMTYSAPSNNAARFFYRLRLKP